MPEDMEDCTLVEKYVEEEDGFARSMVYVYKTKGGRNIRVHSYTDYSYSCDGKPINNFRGWTPREMLEHLAAGKGIV